MKRLHMFTSLLLGLSIVSSSMIPSVMARAFTDVSHQHENHTAIQYVKDNNIVGGYADGTYQADRLINRAEFTKIVIGAQYAQEEIDGCQKNVYWFHDVPQTEWYASYVCLAKQKGIIQGYPDQTFRPTQNITFVEAAKIITIGLQVPTTQETDPWYKPFVNALSIRSSIPTSIDRLEKTITRGEMAEFIYRLKANITDKSSKTYEDFL